MGVLAFEGDMVDGEFFFGVAELIDVENFVALDC